LTPHIGYDKAAEVVKKAMAENKTIRQVVLEMGLMDEAELDRVLDIRKMTEGGFCGGCQWERISAKRDGSGCVIFCGVTKRRCPMRARVVGLFGIGGHRREGAGRRTVERRGLRSGCIAAVIC
jgi:hypothetical protein